jgi:hypothetical protein
MVCETELGLRKDFEDAIQELDLAASEEQTAAHLRMVNARIELVNHRASCPICAAIQHRFDGLG